MHIIIITGLYATSTSPQGGVFIYERLKSLSHQNIQHTTYIIQLRYSPIVSCVYQRITGRIPNSDVLSWSDTENIQVIHYPIGFIKALYLFFKPDFIGKWVLDVLKKYIPRSDDLILHIHWVYPHGWIGVKLSEDSNIPCVVSAHGSDIHSNPNKNKRLKKTTIKTLERATRTIFVSESLLETAKKMGYSGENAIVIPNGIDKNYFFPVNKHTASQEMNWTNTKKFVVGFVGNLIPVKRADTFPEIFTYIQEIVQDVEFILVGDGELRPKLEDEFQKRKLTVTFSGKQPHDKVMYWMNIFDVMILPSRNEGWPTVVLESYACGTPVIGSTNGGIPESLGGLCPSIPEGDNFERRFSETVCNVLTEKIEINRSKLIKHARQYTWDTCVEKEIEVCYDALNE